jgi:DNA-binding winged helix-turn-helix (wHTH) protein
VHCLRKVGIFRQGFRVFTVVSVQTATGSKLPAANPNAKSRAVMLISSDCGKVANLSLSGTDKGVAYEFGEFRFEPENARLLRGGTLLHAEPKALQVLAVLIAATGNLVERYALLDAVWGRVVVTPGTLTRLIADLRRLLEDQPAEPRFIATVHTRGYRFHSQEKPADYPARHRG